MRFRRVLLALLLAGRAAATSLPLAQTRPAAEAPLTILVSIDGWRWDYDAKAPSPSVRALIAPEIEPRLLVRARAEGLSREEVLSRSSGSLPPYGLTELSERA